MLNATLSALSEALQSKKISSVELTRLHLGRIARLDKGLNAFITVDESRAMADAKRADERRAKGEAGPLLGIPVAHKDIFCTKGLLTTCGSKMLANFVSPYDAHVIECFDAALPFGGYKQSGWGREMGYEVLNLYTQIKSVCIRL